MHRDIKPANILIGSNGQVKVADFGIARAMNAPTESNLTQAGAVMGTATYFSPEQAQGAQPDPRSDLYSLGIVMYEMVAGRPPFTGENPVGIAYKQVHDHPQPLNQIVADVPRAVRGDRRQAAGQGPEGPLRECRSAARRPAPLPQRRPGAGPGGRRRARRARPWRTGTAAAAAGGDGGDGRDGRASAPSPRPGAAATGLPTGSSPDARYYEPPPSRTGWYALAAFFALVALGIGGVLLFNALSGDDEPGQPSALGTTSA